MNVVASSAPRPTWQGENIGQVVRATTLGELAELGGRNTTQLIATTPMGDARGYASFEDAVNALKPLTVGDLPMAAIFRDAPGQRFFAHAVKGDGSASRGRPDSGLDGPLNRPLDHDRAVRSIVVYDDDFAGFVDGDWTAATNPAAGRYVDHPAT